jgi:hypothetical protein
MPARHALSQLSYGPLVPSQCSREVEIVSPVDPFSLVVAGWGESKADLLEAFGVSDGDEETSIELEAVERERIDFLPCVQAPDESVSVPSASTAPGDHYVAIPGRPLALHTQEAIVEIEDHVVASTLSNRPIHVDSELRGGQLNGQLGDCAFLIRCHIRQPSGRTGWAVSV